MIPVIVYNEDNQGWIMDTQTKTKYQISLDLLKDMKYDKRKINIAEMTFLEDTLKELVTTIERLEILLYAVKR